MGLSLEKTRAPVEMVVVERMDQDSDGELRMRRLVTRVATPFMLVLATGIAQSQNGAVRLQFDVASVKVDDGPMVPRVSGRVTGGPGTEDPGRITYKQVPLVLLINQAYDVTGDQISGRTDGVFGARFTITAAFSPTTTKEQFRVMLRNLLADRFHLALHHETRSFPGYELVVAAGGPKFHSWTPDPNAEPRIPGKPLQPGQRGGFYWSVTPKPPMIHMVSRQTMADFANDLRAPCSSTRITRGDGDRDEGLMASLRGGFALPVVLPRFIDKTGLTGPYEINFEFEGAMLPRASEGGVTLPDALEKQLGLKLVKVKTVPVDVLVIDNIDKVPTEN